MPMIQLLTQSMSVWASATTVQPCQSLIRASPFGWMSRSLSYLPSSSTRRRWDSNPRRCYPWRVSNPPSIATGSSMSTPQHDSPRLCLPGRVLPESGWGDSNSRPLVPQTSALPLRHIPSEPSHALPRQSPARLAKSHRSRVGVGRLELPTSRSRTVRATKLRHTPLFHTQPFRSTPQQGKANRTAPHHSVPDRGQHCQRVELQGFEPWTFCMPCRRATNCAIAPRPYRTAPSPGYGEPCPTKTAPRRSAPCPATTDRS